MQDVGQAFQPASSRHFPVPCPQLETPLALKNNTGLESPVNRQPGKAALRCLECTAPSPRQNWSRNSQPQQPGLPPQSLGLAQRSPPRTHLRRPLPIQLLKQGDAGCRAGFPACQFTALSSAVSAAPDTPRIQKQHRTGKSGEPAAWKGCSTLLGTHCSIATPELKPEFSTSVTRITASIPSLGTTISPANAPSSPVSSSAFEAGRCWM